MAASTGIKKVAEYAGVSIGTVSKVLNPGTSANNIRFSNETREKVLQAARMLNYQPSYGAKLLRGEKTQTIGFAVSLPGDHNFSFLSDYTFRLLNGIGQKAKERNYQVLLLNGVDYRHFLDVRRLDALILTGFAPERNPYAAEQRTLYSHFNERNYPFAVMHGHEADDGETPVARFGTDNRSGMRQIAELLARRGIEEAGFIGELTSNPQFDHLERLALLRGELAARGIRLREESVIVRSGGDVPDRPRMGNYSEPDGMEALDILLARKALPRAVVCGNDNIAMGVLKRAHDLGLKVPEELGIIGCDDAPWSKFLHPGLTTLHQPLEKLGAAAVEFVLEKRLHPEMENRSMQMEPVLVERESV